jgi:hypothetical protein
LPLGHLASSVRLLVPVAAVVNVTVTVRVELAAIVALDGEALQLERTPLQPATNVTLALPVPVF